MAKRQYHADDDRDPNAESMLFLSLFMILLSFFIVLVALSEIVDQKAEVAIQSVARVFSAIPNPNSNISFLISRRDKGFTTDTVIKDIAKLIRTEISVAEIIRDPREGKLFVSLPVYEFFESGSPSLRADRIIVFKRIAFQAKRLPGNFYASFIVRTKDMPQAQDFVLEAPISVERVANMARRIIAEGLSTRFIDVGIAPSEEEKIDIVFTLKAENFPVIGIEPPQ